MYKVLFSLLAILALSSFVMPETKDEWLETFLHLNWKEEGIYTLKKSNAILVLPKDRVVLLGQEAQYARFLMGNENENIEAITYDFNFDNLVVFEYFKTGYSSFEEWSEMNADEFMDDLKSSAPQLNSELKPDDRIAFNPIGWVQKPIFDKNTQTAKWAYEAYYDGDEPFVNAVGVRLGRHGYEQITWETNKELYSGHEKELDSMLKAFSFSPGFRYEDATPKEKLGVYNVADLYKVSKEDSPFIYYWKFSSIIIGIIIISYEIRSRLREQKINT